MDRVTQQNAALVEQMAASASSLKSQAADLVGAVGTFKVDSRIAVGRTQVRSPRPAHQPFEGSERRTLAPPAKAPAAGPARKPAAVKPVTPKPVVLKTAALKPAPSKPSAPKPPVQAQASAGSKDDEWETF
jgi:hypothetical protein